jgi:cob(I)alamin adenosyltransferase
MLSPKEGKVNTSGLLVVYTGSGKGKTTAALGIAFRALGHGMPVAMVQFIKSNGTAGEHLLAHALPGLTLEVSGKGCMQDRTDLSQDRRAAIEAWQRARDLIHGGAHAIVILDEITHAINYGFITVDQVLDAIAARPGSVHVVVTGRNAPPALLEAADLVTEMSAVKHPFQRGIRGQRGLDF